MSSCFQCLIPEVEKVKVELEMVEASGDALSHQCVSEDGEEIRRMLKQLRYRRGGWNVARACMHMYHRYDVLGMDPRRQIKI